MCSVAPITAALSTVHDPVPPEGASESDKSRLFELRDLRHCHQKGKDSLQLRGKMANLGNKAFHFTPHPETGKIQKQLKNKEFLIAYTLLSEGCESAVPAGWFTAAPAGVFELGRLQDAKPVQQPPSVVHDMPSVPPA